MPSHDLPFTVAPQIDFGKTPIVLNVVALLLTYPLKSACYDRGIPEDVNLDIGCFISLELHSPAPNNLEGLGFVHNWHLLHGHHQFFCPELLSLLPLLLTMSAIAQMSLSA
jgi:hypothetical protein